MAHHDEGFITTSDGRRLYHQSWHGDSEPKAVVMLLHGLGEHSGRYAHVAAALVEAGFAVEAIDHRGHGKSEGRRAYVRKYKWFMDDLMLFREHLGAKHPGAPLVVLGHSMGGNLALGHVLDHQAGVRALVLSGPAIKVGEDFSPMMLKVFKVIARIAPWFRPQGLSADAISRDPAVVEAYRNDPLVFTGKISAGLGAALIRAMEGFPARHRELTLPILIMHGTDDQLASIDGSKELEAGAVNADVTAKYYDGLYHEIFNEPEHDLVLADLTTWLEAAVSPNG